MLPLPARILRVLLLAALVAMSACHTPATLASRDAAPNHPLVAAALLDQIRDQMIVIPAGRFQRGSAQGLADDEFPVQWVAIPRFRLSRYEVTAAQFAAFARATGRQSAAVVQGDHPATNISWDDAIAFIEWLNCLGSEQYRLPTESEWEYAARAGSSTHYWWGDVFQSGHVNGAGLGGSDRWPETAPVGSFSANAFGLHDMLGNVWEWTADCYSPTYENATTDGSASPGEPTCGRVLRGGSWSDTPVWLRSATRNWFERGDRFDYVGFRLAAD